jgi:hypothetical protein
MKSITDISTLKPSELKREVRLATESPELSRSSLSRESARTRDVNGLKRCQLLVGEYCL